ncbi:hypothetical protein SAMN05216522_11325 [Rosenbergiella nectarea]|uniref:Uncharacterized protein n=1 Tax=Rosenbergiella nectarea TaxID=988801 RepID=A0A1H9M0K9_9GAMM|nr:hypothetical protein SAMN05216522_11325 [Rosenbergiella nectarea]
MLFNLAELIDLGNRFFATEAIFLQQTQITLLVGKAESR